MSQSEIDYNYLDRLNPQQRAAVEYKDGPSLVIAGAGSGKTRVLTYKIVDLLRNSFEPWRILALTFTNKAAREMKERVAAVVGEKVASRLWMGTFHSIFLRILRVHADKIGMQPGFTVYDTADSRSLIKTIVRDLNLDEKTYKPAAIASIISNAKNALITPKMYETDHEMREADRRSNRPMISEIYRMYFLRCKQANAMDFDDILMYMNFLLRDNPDVLSHYQEYFKYILVDEYQDTNFAQHLVISQLAKLHNKVCVVGDDAQSIYSFRGANIQNILNLERQFPGLKIFKLERNYRSTQNIINAAGSLIERNQHQMKKHVYSENEPGDPVAVIQTYSDLEEAALVATKIQQSKLMNHDSYDEYAILYRTNAQSRPIEEALRNRNIPYRIYGGLAFYQRKEVKDAICYFRLSINADDDEALRRVINYPARGIGETTVKKLTAAAMANGVSIYAVIRNLENYQVAVNKGTATKLLNFADMIDRFGNASATKDALEAARYIYSETGILTRLYSDKTPESISRQENLTELMAGIKQYVDMQIQAGEDDLSMRTFLSGVFLATDQDESEDADEPRVTLMTVHASKGLEFKHIYIVGAEEELFPSSMATESNEIEEERRLMYVAVTRAKSTCTITYAGSRFRNGQTAYTRPSRFLREFDRRYIKVQSSDSLGIKTGYVNPRDKYRRSRSLFTKSPSSKSSSSKPAAENTTLAPSAASQPESARAMTVQSSFVIATPANVDAGDYRVHRADELAVGMKIAHKVFGTGVITSLITDAGEAVATAEFQKVGTKRLMLRFAKLAIL